MNKQILSLIFIILSSLLAAQNNIGIGTNTPNQYAKLDITSTDKGMLTPRMTTVLRNALTPSLGNSEQGLLVFDTDLQKFFYWDKNIGMTGNWNEVRPGSLSDGKIWIGDATNTAIEQTLSGDVTLSNTGVATIQPNAVQGTDISLTGETNDYIMQYNGTDWVAVDPNTLVVNNIYTADGTLTGNRTVTQGANTLTFSSTATNGFSVDDSTFSIDAANNKIGIGTTAPQYPIHEKRNGQASIYLENTAVGGGSVALFTPSSTSTGGVGTIANNDFPIFTNNTDRITIKATTGNVGIGTSSPIAKLDVVGLNGWDVVNTPGDFRIGNGTYDFRFGVALGGAGAGDAFINSRFGTQRVMLGGGTNNFLLTVDGLNNKVGISVPGNTPSNTKLDINGDLAYREGTALALVNGANSTITPGATSHVRITGPTAAFSIAGISGGVNGKIINIINTTNQTMTLLDNSAATLTDGFYNPGAAPIVIDAQYGSVQLQYNSTLSRWVVHSYSKKDGSTWLLTGNTGTNDPNVPGTYGSSTIASNENWIGTTDANDIVLGTNNIERLRIKQTNGNVGIGTASPNASANLDITATDKGLLIPRVSLTASNLAGPITSPATSLLVYNTATAGTAPNNVTPGYYYWDGLKWVKFMVNNTNTTDLGYIVAWTSNTTPPDYLLPLNGLTYNWSDFPDFQTFHASYPCQFIASSTATTFTLVNINTGGRFLRGATTAGVNQAFSTALPTTAFTTNTTGAHVHSVDPPNTSTTTNGAHTHNIGLRSNDGGWAAGFPNAFHYNMSSGGGGVSTSDRGQTTNANTGIIISSGDHTHTTDIVAFNSASNGDHSHSITGGGDAETRPLNTSVIWCIKVKPTATSGSLTINNTANLATNGLSVYGGPIGLGGILNQNTSIVQGANTLAFTSTATNGFNIDGSTFSVDAANDRIGIGTNSPADKLNILATGGKDLLIGGGATTGSELKLTNSGTTHFSIYNNGNNKLTFSNTSSTFNTNTTGSALMTIDNSGVVGITNLAGTGNRPVFADATGNLTTPQLPKSTQVWNQNSNLPAFNASAFTTSAGSKITIIASGSGYKGTAGLIGMDIYVDGVNRGSCRAYTNEASSHKAFTTNALVVSGLAAGTHSMQLVLRTGSDATTSDANDFFSATVIETPY